MKKKIVIRKKLIEGIRSKIIMESNEEFTSIESLAYNHGFNYILKNILNEFDFSLEELKNEYDIFITTGKSELFAYLYVLDSEFGLSIEDNIYLYRIDDITNQSINKYIPWSYAEGKKYIGDSWWFDDEEIVFDINNLNFIEFIKKYKGF